MGDVVRLTFDPPLDPPEQLYFLPELPRGYRFELRVRRSQVIWVQILRTRWWLVPSWQITTAEIASAYVNKEDDVHKICAAIIAAAHKARAQLLSKGPRHGRRLPAGHRAGQDL